MIDYECVDRKNGVHILRMSEEVSLSNEISVVSQENNNVSCLQRNISGM